MKLIKGEVSVGDNFARAGASRTVYRVASFVESSGLPLHVRLLADGKEQIAPLLMSVSALKDPRFFRRLQQAPG